MRKLLLLCLLLIPLGASAQGFHLEDNATQNVGGFEKPVPAVITVCTSAGTQATPASPCTPVTTIYSDAALTMVKTQSITADANGYYDFYVAPATYFYTICFAGRCATRTLTVPCVTGSSCGGGGAGVSTINGLSGAVIIAAGANITLTPAGNTITIAATAGTGTPCTITALSLQFNNAGSFGCVAQFTYSGSTLTGASGTLTLTAMTAVNLGDTVTSFKNTADATKIGLFSTSGITTGNTRTLSFPDLNGIIQVTNNNQFITGVNTFGSGSGITAQNGSVFNLSAANPLSGFLPPSSAGAAPVTLGVLGFDSTSKCIVIGQGGTTGSLCPGGGAPGGSAGQTQFYSTSTTFGGALDTYTTPFAGADACAKANTAMASADEVILNQQTSTSCAGTIAIPAGKILRFFPNTFLTVNSSMTMDSGSQLLGGGSGSVHGTFFIAKNALNNDVLKIDSGGGFTHWWQAGNFQIDGNAANQASGNGITLGGCGETARLHDILVGAAKQAAFHYTGNLAGSCESDNLTANGSGVGFFFEGTTSTHVITNMKGDSDTIFLKIAPGSGGFGLNARKVQWETSADPGIQIDGTNAGATLNINGLYPGGGYNATNLIQEINGNSSQLILNDVTLLTTFLNVLDDNGTIIRREKFEANRVLGSLHNKVGDAFSNLDLLRADRAVNNGTSQNVAIQNSFMRLTGATAAFAFGGITSGLNGASCGNSCVDEGTVKILYNPSVQTFSLNNEDTGSLVQWRILTNTGANIDIPGPGLVTLIYHTNLAVLSGATPCTITTNVNTCIVATGHLFLSGQHINVASETGCAATINGEHTLTSVTATTIVWSQTAANQSCGANATVAYGRWMLSGSPWPLPTSSMGVTGTGTTGFIPKFTAAAVIGNSACDDGITTANVLTCTQSAGAKFTGPVTTGPDGVHPGDIAMVGNTTAAVIAANTFNLMGPNVTTFTGYALQASSTAPTTGQCLVIGTVAAGVAPLNYNTCPTGGAGTLTASGLSLPVNQIMLGNTYPDTKPLGSLGTTTTVLIGNAAGAPSFGAVNLSSMVTGQLPIAAVGSAGLSGTSPITISAAGAIACATCATGPGASTNHGLATWNGTGGLALESLNTQFTVSATNFTSGATGVVDLSAASATAGLKIPSAAGAVPTADGFIAINTTTHALVIGSNGTTIVEAAAATGTGTSTTCTNQFVTVISSVAAPTCATVNLASAVTGQLPIGNVGSAGLSGTAPIAIAATGVISCVTCATGPGASTNHGLASWNGTGGLTLESLNTQFTLSATNLTSGATGVVDLSAASATGGFKLPTVAGAVPTADGFAAFNSTIHALVTGSNGNTIVQAAAALGTTVSTTCTNQFFTVISAVAAPTCTTATLASAQFANQGTTITVLIGNAAGNPSFGSVNLATMITGQLPIGNVGSAGLSGTSPITIASTGVIACATCATGPGASTNHGLASWNGTGGLALESLNTQFTLSATNFTSGATGVVDLGAASATGGFKVPTVAGAAPTADGFIAFNSTTHAMVSGSNGTTVVGAAAATGTNTSTTCTNQVFTVISAVAAPTCTSLTAAFLPNVPLNQVISPTGAVATFADGDNALVFNSAATTSGRVAFTIGETTASTAATTAQLLRLVTLATSTAVPLTISQGSGVNATNAPLAVSITGGAGGANAGATNPGFKGGGVTAIAGNGSNAGATSGTGGAGGDITLTAGTGGTAAVASTTGAGGNIILTPGAAGGTGTAGLIGVVQVAGANAGFFYLTQGSANTTANTNIPTNSIIDQAPAAVTAYSVIRPGVTATGVVTNNVASAVDTQGVSGDANHSATVTIGSGTSIGSTSLCSTGNCPVGIYAIHVYVDITTACGTSGTYIVNLIYTDDQGSKTVPVNINGTGSVPATGVLTTTSTANFGENAQVIRSTGAASINYSTTATACGTAGPMVGKLYLAAVPIM